MNALVFLAVNQYVIDYTWVPVSYLLVIQPTRFSLYIFYFALGVHAYRRRWFTAGGYRPRIATWLPLSLLLGAAFMMYKLAFGLKLDQLKYRAGNDLLHCAFCLASVFALIALFEKLVNRSSGLWRGLARNSYAIYCVHMVIVPRGRADDSAAAVEHPREVRGDGDAVAADFVCGVGVRCVADAAVRDGKKTCRRLKPAPLFSARLPTASAVG